MIRLTQFVGGHRFYNVTMESTKTISNKDYHIKKSILFRKRNSGIHFAGLLDSSLIKTMVFNCSVCKLGTVTITYKQIMVPYLMSTKITFILSINHVNNVLNKKKRTIPHSL